MIPIIALGGVGSPLGPSVAFSAATFEIAREIFLFLKKQGDDPLMICIGSGPSKQDGRDMVVADRKWASGKSSQEIAQCISANIK